jgi:ribosome-associated protein
MTMQETNSELNTLKRILEDIHAIDINIIDVREHTTITDYMVVCSGRSSRHVRSIAEYTMEHMKAAHVPAIHSTGLDNGEWALIDFGNFIVHIFQPDARTFFNLEGLWQNPR